MFSDHLESTGILQISITRGIRLSGLDILAKHRIGEGMQLCTDVMEIDKWGKRERGRLLEILGTYGAAAKPVLPQLRQMGKKLAVDPEAKGRHPVID